MWTVYSRQSICFKYTEANEVHFCYYCIFLDFTFSCVSECIFRDYLTLIRMFTEYPGLLSEILSIARKTTNYSVPGVTHTAATLLFVCLFV